MPEIAIIFAGIIIGLIVIGISVNALVGQVLDFKKSQSGTGILHGGQSADVQALNDRTDMIEDRLRVLERIATDRGHLLAEEIEALRSDINTRDRALESRQLEKEA